MKYILAVFLFGFSVAEINAGYKMGETRPVKVTKSSPKKLKKFVLPTQNGRVENPEIASLQALADRYTTPIDRLEYFRKLRHGYEEIVPALIVAREAQVESGRILQMRMTGQSWKDIAQYFDINLQPLNEEVEIVLEPLRKTLSKQALTERPATRK